MNQNHHYAEGEKQLRDAEEQAGDGFHDDAAVTTQFAIAHALLAVADRAQQIAASFHELGELLNAWRADVEAVPFPPKIPVPATEGTTTGE